MLRYLDVLRGQKKPFSDGAERLCNVLSIICLPEIDVECYGNTKDDNGVDNIPVVPAGTGGGNLLGSRGAEYQPLDFILVGSFGN